MSKVGPVEGSVQEGVKLNGVSYRKMEHMRDNKYGGKRKEGV